MLSPIENGNPILVFWCNRLRHGVLQLAADGFSKNLPASLCESGKSPEIRK
jgi:hypothetical protein